MEIFSNILIVLVLLGFLFLLFKPKKQAKSKEQKQEEIRLHYHEKLHSALLGIEDSNERQKKKIALISVFARELEFNLFFDADEVKILIQQLARY